jgi:hypothetical protein
MKKYSTIFIFIFFLFTQADIMAQAPPPPGGFEGGASCWPPSPSCDPVSPVPINKGLVFLIIAGLGVVFLQNKKKIASRP